MRVWLIYYTEKSGVTIVANKGRVYRDRDTAKREFDGFVMHSGCESVTLAECITDTFDLRINEEKSPTCRKCQSDHTEYYGEQLHCFNCGAVYRLVLAS